ISLANYEHHDCLRADLATRLLTSVLAIPSLLAMGGLWTPENTAWNVNVNSDPNPAGYYGAWSNHTYFPSPDDWRKVPIYQFITDRFNDGDPSNNEVAYPGYDLRDFGARHGGD